MKIKKYTIDSSKVKDDKTIAVVADLHFNRKTENKKLDTVLSTLDEIKPSHIVIPGDLYNPDRCTVWGEMATFSSFIQNMMDIAPIYYVKGNSELQNNIFSYWDYPKNYPNFHVLCERAEENKEVNVLQEDDIAFAGLKLPPAFYTLNEKEKVEYLIQKYSFYLETISRQIGYSSFSVLLCHDPIVAKAIEDAFKYDFSIYFDLIISGHNHGGVFPKILKPILKKTNVDIDKAYPTYTKGLVKYDDTRGRMLVSSGLTKYSPGFGMLENFENFHEGTIEAVRIRKRQ